MSRHANISVFVPHVGCPNQCSYCNQRHITGTFKIPREKDVDSAVAAALKSRTYDPQNTEIAFFGGSFTAINPGYMTSLLKAANVYVKNGTVRGIRLSTRPDAIGRDILNLLSEYGVTSIELGAQSLNDRVLKMNNRGHTSSDVYKACELIREYGFELGLQIMTGLYADSDESALDTAGKVVGIRPDTVRIYPTIVLKDTCLAALYADGIYKPQSLDEAICLSAELYRIFTDAGIRVIRLGLHSIESDAYVAGPWHPAFSELCLSKIMLDKALSQLGEKGKYIIYVNKSDISKMTGQNRSNIEYLAERGYYCRVKGSDGLENLEIKTEREV